MGTLSSSRTTPVQSAVSAAQRRGGARIPRQAKATAKRRIHPMQHRSSQIRFDCGAPGVSPDKMPKRMPARDWLRGIGNAVRLTEREPVPATEPTVQYIPSDGIKKYVPYLPFAASIVLTEEGMSFSPAVVSQ